MTGWAPRRFWAEARAEPVAGGHGVRLDARWLHTPAKAPLTLPTAALAGAVAEEWAAQRAEVRPETMPLTRAANAAIDKVAPMQAEVVEVIAAWGGSDLLCYRAEGPAGLAARQAAAWDPLLDWAARDLGAPLAVTAGVMPCPQPGQSLAALRARVAACDAFALTALSDLVGLSGSLVIGLAALDGLRTGEALWEMSRIDEAWQEEHWGPDAEAARATAHRRADFLAALRFHALSRITLSC